MVVSGINKRLTISDYSISTSKTVQKEPGYTPNAVEQTIEEKQVRLLTE